MPGGSDQDRADARDFRRFADICGRAACGRPVPPIAEPVDAGALAALADRHRIATGALDALAQAVRAEDDAVADRLAAKARARRFGALRKAERMAAISRALSAGGIRHLGIKGPVLAQQIHGDVAARDSKDLDLLVDPAAMTEATAVLHGLGFAAADGDEAGALANKHRSFFGDGIEIEVHDRLLDVDALLPLSFERVWQARETVMIGNVAVPALGVVDTLLYLCAHGAQHLWFRLKWLEDIARIVVTRPDCVGEALDAARAAGADAIVTSALQLVDDLFGVVNPEPPLATRASRALVRLSKAALLAPAEHASTPPIGAILRKLPVQFGMGRSWRYRRDLARLLLLAPRGFDAKTLPRGFRWLRLPLRPAMLLRDRWTHKRRR